MIERATKIESIQTVCDRALCRNLSSQHMFSSNQRLLYHHFILHFQNV